MLPAERVRAALEELSPTQEKVDLAVSSSGRRDRTALACVIFGSWPRGEAKWDSDLDLAVLLDDAREADLGAIRRILRRKLDEIPMSIDLVLTTVSCAEQFRGSINSIYHRILTEGQVVYGEPIVFSGSNSPHQGR